MLPDLALLLVGGNMGVQVIGDSSYMTPRVEQPTQGRVSDLPTPMPIPPPQKQVMTKEHISIACALQIPLAVVVTKVDIAPESVLKQTRQTLARYLRKNAKMPYPVKEMSQASARAWGCLYIRV